MKKSAALLRAAGCFLLLSGLLCPARIVRAQEQLTLEKSLELARERNVLLRQARHNASMAAISLNRSRSEYLPDVNATADVSRIFGTAFDNNTFQRVKRTTTTSYPGISASMVLFDGFANYFALKQAKLLAEAGQHTVAKVENDVEAAVTRHYLQAILDLENIRIAEERVELLQGLLSKTEKLEKAGVRTEENVYLIRSQLANEKLDLLTHRNTYRHNLLLLLQQIDADPNQAYTLEAPPALSAAAITAPLPFDSMMQQAAAVSPDLKAARLRLLAAKQALHLSRSNLSPTLSLSGTAGSSYSSNGLFDPETRQVIQAPYFDQISENLYQVVSLTLRVPVFNGFANHYNNQTARLQLRNAELDYRTTENLVRQNIQQAYQDVVTAQEKYRAVQTELEAVQKSFDYSRRRYETGTTDFYAYMETLNNKNKVEAQLLQSRYEYYFKTRILELYL